MLGRAVNFSSSGTFGIGKAPRGAIQCQLGGIAVTTKVTEDNVLKRGLELAEHAGGSGVGKVPVAGENALLD